MRIGIDASRAFLRRRTGIEEYSYQVIQHLVDKLKNHQIVLYVKKGQAVDFDLPKNWKVKTISWKYFWTQVGLSLEMIFNPVDVLFIPAHIIPWFFPKKTIVTVHGLEYEFCPGAYSFWEKLYMRFFIKRSCRKASKIIAVSQNTKKDLVNLYKIPTEKIEVVYEGVNFEFPLWKRGIKGDSKSSENSSNPSPTLPFLKGERFLLFLGRIEERKNVLGIIKAFEIFKEKYKLPHKLVLAGKPGHGYNSIKSKVQSLKSKARKDIVELGFVREKEKWQLLQNADVFLFPSLYEGFGLPILEAQSVGTAVVTSKVSSIPEVVGESAVLIDPKDYQALAEAMYKLVSDENLRNDIIEKGYENVKRFSWEKCASQIAEIIG